MANRNPGNINASLDQGSAQSITDLSLANVEVMQQVDIAQFGLVTRWGSPDVWIPGAMLDGGTNWNGSSYDAVSGTFGFRLFVPPYVTEARYTLLVAGIGKALLRTDTDSTGSELKWSFNESTEIDGSAFVYSAGAIPSSEGAGTGRAITVASGATAEWTTEDVRVDVTRTNETGTVYGSPNSTPGKVYGVGISWIWEPRDITDSASV